MALWTRAQDGLIVCAGCAHAGLDNTLNHVQRLNHGLPIRAVIGGFHLVNAAEQQLEAAIAALKALDPDRIIPCHCTGERAIADLKTAFAERCCPGAAGMTFVF